ncbi:iron uptake transporter permease EfeU [Aestuariimicrobium soli]|uniref:iron uptake transporter permease EfeU n=1 Tax=Aestuariimicrobium soli TaxID=2035834 RepID=UPI003EC00336
MLANYLIGLREGLEASLVVVILIAWLVKTDRRSLIGKIWAGVAIAIAVSLAFGAALTFGPKGLTVQAQEAIGGVLSIIATGFVTWMILWMAKAARGLSGELRAAVDKAAAGQARGGLIALAVLAVGREGLETALFLWAATNTAANGGSAVTPLVGALLGIATAVALSWLSYKGVLSLNLGVFFRWTGAILVLIAGGVLAYGIHDLQEAGIVPGLNAHAWDISGVIPPDSVPAVVAKGIFNFSPTPTWAEVIAWVAYVAVVMTLFVRSQRTTRKPATSAVAGRAATAS